MSTLGAFKTVYFTSSHLICTGGLYTYVPFLYVPQNVVRSVGPTATAIHPETALFRNMLQRAWTL